MRRTLARRRGHHAPKPQDLAQRDDSHDPRGRPYYRIDEHVPLADAEPGTDYAAVRDGLVSITPLRFDHTAEELLSELEKWTRSL